MEHLQPYLVYVYASGSLKVALKVPKQENAFVGSKKSWKSAISEASKERHPQGSGTSEETE